MIQTQIKMSDLYDRLADIGFPKKFVQEKILPDWWCEEADETPGIFLEGALYISRRLNLDVRSLLTAQTQPVFEATCQPKFKLKTGTDIEQLMIPRALSARVAELVAYGCKQPYQGLDGMSVAQIRQEILQNREALDLRGFLEFCWQRGIPVIHFAEFPPKVQKFDGMVAYFYNRPVILVSLKDCSPARLLFIVAHELGHILKGHINQEGLLVDEQIELESSDDEEFEANQVAAELLLGRYGITYDLWQKFISGDQLANKALELAKKDRVNPGVIVFNISWNRAGRAVTKDAKNIIWATAKKALKVLEPNADAPRQINNYILQNLDWEKLGDDNQDYLAGMLGLTFENIG